MDKNEFERNNKVSEVWHTVHIKVETYHLLMFKEHYSCDIELNSD